MRITNTLPPFILLDFKNFVFRRKIDSKYSEIINFIPKYFEQNQFKLIYRHNYRHNSTNTEGFTRVGDIDNIIKQITKEDFELKYNTYKYNL